MLYTRWALIIKISRNKIKGLYKEGQKQGEIEENECKEN